MGALGVYKNFMKTGGAVERTIESNRAVVVNAEKLMKSSETNLETAKKAVTDADFGTSLEDLKKFADKQAAEEVIHDKNKISYKEEVDKEKKMQEFLEAKGDKEKMKNYVARGKQDKNSVVSPGQAMEYYGKNAANWISGADHVGWDRAKAVGIRGGTVVGGTVLAGTGIHLAGKAFDSDN